MLESHDVHDDQDNTDRLSGPAVTFTHPDEVLHDCSLSVAAKRAILAAWASDAHAVPNLPAMRQLDSGALVTIDAVLDALRALDGPYHTAGQKGPRAPTAGSRQAVISRWHWPLRSHDDDDDPPPCPAGALPVGIERKLRRRDAAAWTLAAA